MQGKKRLHRIVCLVLGILMMFSTLTTAFAGSASWVQPGGTAHSSGYVAGNQWESPQNPQFLRISLYWAPKAAAGTPNVGQDGADWSSSQVKHLGTFDWVAGGTDEYNKYNPSATVIQHSNYTNAIQYYKGGNANRMGTFSNYYATSSNGSTKIVRAYYTLKDNNGNPMAFPRPVGKAQAKGTDLKKFFTQDETINQIQYILNYTTGRYGTKQGLDGVSRDELKNGIYKLNSGIKVQGSYLLTIEPGVYMPVQGVYTAFTMRDALAWGQFNNAAVDWAPYAVEVAAQAAVLEPGMNYPALGLSYREPVANMSPDGTHNYLRNEANWSTMRSSYGIGAVAFWSDVQQLPVINYYYDLTEEDFVRAGLLLTPDEEDSTLYHIYDADGNELSIYEAITDYPEVVNRKADNASTAAVTGNTYTAPRESEALSLVDDGKSGQVKTYNLIAGYMTNKQVTAGYLNITNDGGGLQFYDNNGKANITEEAKEHTQDPELTQEKIKQWDDSEKLVTTVGENAKASKLVGQSHLKVVEDGIQLNLGQDNGSLQGAFIYVDLKVPVWPDITTLNDPGEPIDPDPEDKTPYVPPQYTNVTKMYYDSPEDTTPSKTSSEKIPTSATYEIEDEEEYKVVDWVIVDDNTPDEPEPYPTYEEAKDNQSEEGKTGTTPGSLGPSNWTNPDRELFIKYEKAPEEEEPEPLDGSLRLTEKRISWLKSLEDIGGIPTITFQWAAITGHEIDYDGCGTAESPCPGHSCNEHIGKDSFLRFVSSNTTPVKSDIMGNKSGFMPYDEDNVYEFNRGDAGGSYDMHPNYWYVIWRGKDIPTIASYKYGDTTGSGKATSAPIIKNLIGENMVGIKPAGARHPNNNSFYMDSFTITEGKSNYDTGNLSAFEDTFGAQEGGLGDQAFANTLDEYHDISEQYEKAEGDVKLAEEEKNRRLSALEQAHQAHDNRQHTGRYSGTFVEGSYSSCRTCQSYQTAYDQALADYNAKVIIRDNLLAKYTELGNKLGETKSKAGEGTKNLGDYDYSTTWSFCGKENWYNATGGSQTFTPDVRVDVGYGTQNTGNAKVTFKSNKLNAFGIDYDNVVGFPINNTAAIKFYPYVEMLYDTTTGLKDQKVYVLGGHESTLVPQDYIEVGFKTNAYNAEHGTGLVIESQQWSVHTAALKLGSSLGNNGKNKVLPGGAIYRLRTPSENGKNSRTTVAISSWLTVLPSDTINATTAGKDVYTGTLQNNKNEALFREVLRSFNSLDIVQVVGNTQLAQEQAGSQSVVNGQKTSTSAKYWLKQNLIDGTGVDSVASAMAINSKATNEADLDIVSQKEARTYYRIYSDVNGNVYVTKSTTSQEATAPGKGTIIAQINKTQSLSDLTKVAEVKDLDDRTNIVKNYLSAIDRNIGNDVSLSDPKWYNEAFDGICVVRIDKQIELGFVDNGAANATRTAAIDPKLQPARKSQGELFTDSVTSYFRTDTHTNMSGEAGYIGTYKPGNTGAPDVKIVMSNMEGIYKSKNFMIPNASVMDVSR